MKSIVLFFFVFQFSIAQTTISGKVVDKKQRPIAGANVFIEGSYDGALTNNEGNFSFTTTEKGNQTLSVTQSGYELFIMLIDVNASTSLLIQLNEDVNALDAVILTSGAFEAGDKARVSVLKPLDIVTTAGAAGDIIGALNTLPGTQANAENGRLFVRGGEADETQTFVDGVRVAQPYGANANNLPTRSRFSPFLFSGVSFSTGGYSAEYGEALSSVLLLNTIDEPDQEKTDIAQMTVGLSLGNTQRWKDKSISFNANYINLAPYQKLVPQDVDWNKPFQSFGGETVYRHPFKRGLLKVYAAFEATQLDLNQEDINFTEKVRFNLDNSNFYLNAVYKGNFGTNWNLTAGIGYGYGSNTININRDNVFNAEHASHFKIKLGKKFSQNIRLIGGIDVFSTQFDETFTPFGGIAFENGFTKNIFATYLETDIFFTKKLALKAGGRLAYNDFLKERYINPRVSFAYKLSKSSQFTLLYGDFNQTPRQDYIKFSENLSTESAQHYILNYQYSKDNRLLRLDAYYKEYDDLITFSTQTPTFNSVYSNNGFGYAKGIDVFWRDNKTIKNTEYWVSYSFIDSKRQYQNFPSQVTPSFVAKHTLSVVTKHWIGKLKSQIGFSYTINSGRPFNNPNEDAFMNGRTPSFQNLAFNWAYLITPQKILYFSVSNITGNNNIFGYQYANNQNIDGVFERSAILQPAPRFFFVGFFWTISEKKNDNQLNNL